MIRRLASAFALTVLVFAAACTAGGADVPPIEFKERVLENGLRVITSHDAATPNVTVQVWYQVGSKDDPLGRSGFAHMFEHMMFKSARDMPNEMLDRLTEDVGGWNNASTWDDFTNYYEVVPASHLERLIWAEAERMSSLVVDEANFKSERDVVKEELRQNTLADPYGRLFGLMLAQATYKEHPYKRPGIGNIEELDAATLDDLRAFHRDYYRPDNAALIVVGNFDEAQLDAWIEKYFGPIQKPAAPIKRVTVSEPARAGPGEFEGFGPNVPLPAVVMTWLGPKADDPDAPALKVLDAILSSGESSRLYNALVYDQQIATQIFSTAELPAQPGYFAVGAIMAGGKDLPAGEQALLAEVAKLRDSAPSRQELDEAKNELITAALRNRETVDGRGFALGYALMVDGSAAQANEELDDLRAVTAADIKRVAQKYLAEDRRMTIRYRPESAKPAGWVDPVPPSPHVASIVYDGPTFSLAPEAERMAPPAVGAAVNPVLPAPSEKTLANGLRVVVAHSTELPLVTANLSIKAGSWADPPELSGVTAMAAWMLTEGTTTRSATDIASQTEALGASLSSSGGPEVASVGLSVMSDKLAPAMEIMADVTMNPAFSAEEVDRQRTLMIDDLSVQYSSPRSLTSYATEAVVYAGTAFGHMITGTPRSIAKYTPDHLKQAHQTYYRPDNAILVITGDITPEAGFALAEKAFGGWTKPDTALPAAPTIAANTATRTVIIDLPAADQSSVVVIGPGIRRTDPAYYASVVTNAILGTGYSSRLNMEVRIKRGLSYGASSAMRMRSTTGAFVAGAQTKNESALQVLSIIREQLRLLGSEPVGPAEMTARKSVVIGDFGRDLETTGGLAGLISDLAFYGLPLDEIGRYTSQVEAVTPAQIQAFAARVLDPTKTSVVIAGPVRMFGGAPGPIEVVPAEGIDFDSPTLKPATASQPSG